MTKFANPTFAEFFGSDNYRAGYDRIDWGKSETKAYCTTDEGMVIIHCACGLSSMSTYKDEAPLYLCGNCGTTHKIDTLGVEI